MKKFKIPCNFNGKTSPVTFYIGQPHSDHNPIHFQSQWLSSERGGSVPQKVLDSLEELFEMSKKNGVSFENLCEYAFNSVEAEKSIEAKESLNKKKEKNHTEENKS